MSTWVINTYDDELYHHGIKGQKWGVRRYQNEDGSLTPEGIKRYGTVENFEKAQRKKKIAKRIAIGAGAGVGAAAAGLGLYALSKYKRTEEPLPDGLPMKTPLLPGPSGPRGNAKALPDNRSDLNTVRNNAPHVAGIKINRVKDTEQGKKGQNIVDGLMAAMSGSDNFDNVMKDKNSRLVFS